MSSASSSPEEVWDALDSLTLQLAPFVSPSGKQGVVPRGLGLSLSSIPMDVAPPASNVALVSLVFVKGGVGVDVCGGRVGTDRVKFCCSECLATGTSCGTASHVKKMNLQSPAYYIRIPHSGSTSTHAFVSPVLTVPETGFDSQVLSILEGQRSVSSWMDVFTALTDIHLLDADDRAEIFNRLKSVDGSDLSVGYTPMRFKKRRVEGVGHDPLGMEVIDEATTGSWVIDSPDEPTVLPRDEAFEKRIMHVVDSWDKVVLSGKRQRELTGEVQMDMKRYLEVIDNKIVKVVTSLGNVNFSNVPGLTVWSSIEAHEAAIEEGRQMFGEYRGQTDGKLNSVVNDVKDVRKVISERIVTTLQVLTERIASPMMSGEGGTHALQQEISILGASIDQLKGELADMKTGRGGSANMDSAETLEELRQEMGIMKDEILSLQAENQRLRAETNSEIVEFGGFVFNAPSTYVTWVATHLPSAQFNFCFDFISLLECFSNQNRGSEDGLKMAESIKKAGYKDKQVALIDQSFGCTFPKIFGDEQDTSNPAKKMAKLKSVIDWDNPSANTGLKVRINTFITAFRKTVDTQIIARLGYGSTATTFFHNLMQHNVKFWEAFSSWITRFESELVHRGGGDNPKLHQEGSWNLVCWMIHSMFVEMNIRRSPGTGMTMDDGDNEIKIEKCASILHGTLSAHKFMAELIKDEFVRHPIFASTMDEFLLTSKAAQATVDAMVTKMKKLEECINGIQAVADKAMQEAKKPHGGKGNK